MITIKTDSKTRKILFGGEARKLCNNASRSALKEIGNLITKEVKKGIENPPKTGRLYGVHKASKKGEYPADKTGTLKKSINHKIKSARKTMINANASYAGYLEYGTSKIGKRKLIEYTVKKNRDKIRNIIRQNINSEFK